MIILKLFIPELFKKTERNRSKSGLKSLFMADFTLPHAGFLIIDGFSEEELSYFQDYLASVAHIIMQLAREGGFEGGNEDASSF